MKRSHRTRPVTQDLLEYPPPQLLNRSCIPCHQRKVRCDRKTPCANCEKAGWDCLYPNKHGNIIRKVQSLQDISDRLERIESILPNLRDSQNWRKDHDPLEKSAASASTRNLQPREVLLEDGGRLQYVNNSNILDLLQDEISTRLPPAPVNENNTAATISPSLNMKPDILPVFSKCSVRVSQLYPEPQHALRLWATYMENVNPVLKLLHTPTAQSTIIGTILDPQASNSSSMALAFAVFFAAVTSMNDREARESLLENRQHLLRRYSAGLNQALVDGDYLGNPKVTELQALTIFVTCLRAHDTSRAVWVLIGTTIRLAQSIGLHRDGMLLKLCPFETEIRVRLWWHLCLLDSRSPEDHGFELTLDIFNQGPRLPLNVNDNQLYPDMKALPEGSEVWTEMTFFLVQIEAAKILHPVLRTKQDSGTDALGDLMTKRQMIADHVRLIEDRYLSNGNMDIPLHRAAFYHYHTACEKMRFMLQLREELYLQPNKISDNPDHVVRQSFTMAYRVLEGSYFLLTKDCSMHFTWIFHVYTQWYALAYVLRCLSFYPRCRETDLAWDLVNKILRLIDSFGDGYWNGSSTSETNSIWACLEALRMQAVQRRVGTAPDSGELNRQCLSTQTHPAEGKEASELHHVSTPTIPPGPVARRIPDITVDQDMQNSLAGLQPGPFYLEDCQVPGMAFLQDWSAIINGNLDSIGIV